MKTTYLQKFFLLVIVFSYHVVTQAQDKGAKKIMILYDAKKYEKCIKKSKKLIHKDHKNVTAHFFQSLSYFNLALAKGSDKERLNDLKYSIRSLSKVKKYNNDLYFFDSYQVQLDTIQVYLNQIADSLYKTNKRKAKFYYDKLAEIYNDTSAYYYVFHSDMEEKGEERIEFTLKDTHEQLEEIRKEMLQAVISVIGTRYVYGGEDTTGFDCSGFTKYAYQQIGIELPHNAQLQSQLGVVVGIEDAQPGDLIFFGSKYDDGTYRAIHAGMIFDNRDGHIDLIHCVSGGVNVHDSENTNNQYWLGRALFVKRIIGEITDDPLTDKED